MKPLRIAVTCPAVSGHLNPSLTLASELKRRGHHVVMAAFLDAEPKAHAAGVPFCAVAADEYPRGRIPELMRELGTLSGFAAFRFTIDFFRSEMLTYLRDLPPIWKSERIDALVLDQCSGGAATAAQALKLPYATICNALWFNRDKASPPWTTHWAHGSGLWSRVRNWVAHAPIQAMIAYAERPLNQRRRSLDLKPLSYGDWAESPLAIVSQQPEGFEFPEERVPEHLHFTGPFFRMETREPTPFPFERLDGRPLIYTSMGTIQNQLLPVFRTISAACVGLDAQLVIALGVKDAVPPQDFPGNPLVVPFAPQLELLQRASVVITHAGLNTALESLAHGVPMVAIPIANDQPGVAARLARIGAAEVIPLAKINESRVRAAIKAVLENPKYREAARKMQRQIEAANGLQKAADIVEQTLTSRQPVLRHGRSGDSPAVLDIPNPELAGPVPMERPQ